MTSNWVIWLTILSHYILSSPLPLLSTEETLWQIAVLTFGRRSYQATITIKAFYSIQSCHPQYNLVFITDVYSLCFQRPLNSTLSNKHCSCMVILMIITKQFTISWQNPVVRNTNSAIILTMKFSYNSLQLIFKRQDNGALTGLIYSLKKAEESQFFNKIIKKILTKCQFK